MIILLCWRRDLKSSNVLMRGEDGDCVLADLGLALVLKPINDPMDIANCGQVGVVWTGGCGVGRWV